MWVSSSDLLLATVHALKSSFMNIMYSPRSDGQGVVFYQGDQDGASAGHAQPVPKNGPTIQDKLVACKPISISSLL